MVLSEVETKGVRKRDYNGLIVYEIAKCPVPVTATVAYGNSNRIVFEGTFTIDRTEGSWKFPEEVQFVLYTRKLPRFEKRAKHDGYHRIEIPIPRGIATKMLELALRKLWLLPEGDVFG